MRIKEYCWEHPHIKISKRNPCYICKIEEKNGKIKTFILKLLYGEFYTCNILMDEFNKIINKIIKENEEVKSNENRN